MQKVVKFAVNNDIEIKNEVVSGILLDILPLQADGITVCDIADLNKISFDLILDRDGAKPQYIFQGYLEDILIGMYSQTTKFAISKTKRSNGYKVMLDLTPGAIALSGNDVLRVKIKAENIAFTSLSNPNSSITVESVPTDVATPFIPVLKSFPIGSGEIIVDKDCGDGVVKATLLTDLGSDYDSSTEAKPQGVDIFAVGYEKSVSQNLLESENIHYLDFNPDTAIQDLVLYSGAPKNAVRIKSKLSKGALAEAKLLVVSLIQA